MPLMRCVWISQMFYFLEVSIGVSEILGEISILRVRCVSVSPRLPIRFPTPFFAHPLYSAASNIF